MCPLADNQHPKIRFDVQETFYVYMYYKLIVLHNPTKHLLLLIQYFLEI